VTPVPIDPSLAAGTDDSVSDSIEDDTASDSTEDERESDSSEDESDE